MNTEGSKEKISNQINVGTVKLNINSTDYLSPNGTRERLMNKGIKEYSKP